MKKIILLVSALFLLSLSAEAQIKWGLRGGLSSYNVNEEISKGNGISVAIDNADYGYHLGLFGRIKFGKHIYLQPEAVFNSNTVNLTIKDITQVGVFREKYQNLDIPLMLGLKFGPLRLEGGPAGHVRIASKSELNNNGGPYEHRFNDFTLGYQTGIGLEVWKILVDLRYEGNLTKFGDHINIGNKELPFSDRLNRWILSVGFSF